MNETQGSTLFSRKDRTEVEPVKTIVNGTQGTIQYISQERVRLKIAQSKMVLKVQRVQRYFTGKE